MLFKQQPASTITFGISLKNPDRPENNNMALHSCENPEAVVENRKRLAEELGVSLDQFVLAQQTHSNHFYHVTSKDKGRGAWTTEDAISDTDALFTYEPNIVLGAFTADCVPLLFWSEQSHLIASVHSGWQGTVKEIVPALLLHLKDQHGEDLSSVHAFIGPALSEEKFEVDSDVAELYKQLGYADAFIRFKEETGKYHIDNALTVREQCIRAGIRPDFIDHSTVCTYQSPDGFSYRQNKKDGRHLVFILRTE